MTAEDQQYRLSQRAKGMHDLLYAFNVLRRRPPRYKFLDRRPSKEKWLPRLYRNIDWNSTRDKPLPNLCVKGPEEVTREILGGFDRACNDDPCAMLAPGTEYPHGVHGLVREAAQGLSKNSRRWEPTIRFPLLERMLWLLEQPPPPQANDRQRRRELFRRVRKKAHAGVMAADRSVRNLLLEAMEKIISPIVPVIGAISLTASTFMDNTISVAMLSGVVLLVLLRTTSPFVGRLFPWRYRWFLRQPFFSRDDNGTDYRKFWDFALGVVDARGSGRRTEEIEHLLVNAFLQDLSRAYRRTFRRRAPWARVAYPVLMVHDIQEGSPAYRLVRRIEEVRAEVRENASPTDPLGSLDPLLIVVSSESNVSPPTAATHIQERQSDAPLWSFFNLRKLPSGGDPSAAPEARQVNLSPLGGFPDPDPVSPEKIDELLGEWLRDRERYALFGPSRTLSVELSEHDRMFVDELDRAASGFRGDFPIRRRPVFAHPGFAVTAVVTILISAAGVAVAQGNAYCDTDTVRRFSVERIGGECIGISDGSYAFSPVLEPVMDRIRGQNREATSGDGEHVTVVFIGALSEKAEVNEPTILAGARGELLGTALRQEAVNSESPVKIRVLVANAGVRFGHGQRVAERIVEYAAGDSSTVAVLGFGQSTQGTEQAIETLNDAGLPMVGTAMTARPTVSVGPAKFSRFFYPMAPYNTAIARQAAHWAREGLPGTNLDGAETAAVFIDTTTGDLYSRDLGEAFRGGFGGADTRRYRYSNAAEISGQVRDACEEQPDIFYYAGRSDHIDTLLRELQGSTCAGGEAITVMASDAITQYVGDHYARGLAPPERIELYYTPLAAREVWDTGPHSPDYSPTDFYPTYDALVAELANDQPAEGERAPSEAHAALASDALELVSRAVNYAYEEQRATVPTAIGYAFTKVVPFNGTSGTVEFDERAQAHAIVDKPVVLLRAFPMARQEVVTHCGRLTHDYPDQGVCI